MRLEGLRLERARASAQFHDGRFRNTAPVTAGLARGSGGTIMREFLFGGARRKPPGDIPVESPLAGWGADVSSDGLRVTWLGHSTMLLELDGARVLTDPVFGTRLGPLPSLVGPRRFHAAPVTIAQLPPLDAILVSHDHYDHLCKTTWLELAQRRVPVVTSLGVGMLLERFGVAPELITELDWGERATVNGVGFTATPSQHFSGRLGSARNTTLWSSWVIEAARRKVFFSGDTGLTPEFAAIGRVHGPFDLTMLEIGAWHPAWGTIHLGPENALAAFAMLGGGTLLPVHWSTFDLGLHPWAQPAETLVALAAARGARIITPPIGRPFEPAHLDGPTPWWRDVAGVREDLAADQRATAQAPAPDGAR
ncbi:MAG: MBL fold metallo-hydrolase [Myxococcales bacterium]|nr:MBL fold metallo-hydrolase [Myxococcales bacterium]